MYMYMYISDMYMYISERIQHQQFLYTSLRNLTVSLIPWLVDCLIFGKLVSLVVVLWLAHV